MNTPQTWDEFLSSYENQLDSTNAALDLGNELDPTVLGEFVPPTHLGPPPFTHVNRIIEMVRKSHEIGEKLQAAQNLLGQEISALTVQQTRSPFSDAPTPRYFDSAV